MWRWIVVGHGGVYRKEQLGRVVRAQREERREADAEQLRVVVDAGQQQAHDAALHDDRFERNASAR